MGDSGHGRLCLCVGVAENQRHRWAPGSLYATAAASHHFHSIVYYDSRR